jgi:uncharacterized HAD superfamily protein
VEKMKKGEDVMSSKNKRNILYFESSSMRKLYKRLQKWQKKNNKRFLSISIHKDNGKLCCVALTNPSEVVIANGGRLNEAAVIDGALRVHETG